MEHTNVTPQSAWGRLATIVGLLGLLALGLVVLFSDQGAFAAGPRDAAQDTAAVSQVYITPASASMSPGETLNLTVKVDAIAYIYGAQYRIEFDPDVLEVVDADPSMPGVQIGSAAMLPEGLFYEMNQVDNATGVISYTATILEPGEPVAGSGAFGSIAFRAKTEGQSAIAFEGNARWPLALTDRSGYAVAAEWTDGAVVVGNERMYLPLTLGD